MAGSFTTTSKVVTALTAHAASRTYSFWINQAGAGGGNLGRVFDKNLTEMLYNSAGELVFERQFSTTNGVWKITKPSAANHHCMIVYDSSSAANNPVIYIDGVSVTVTETTAPAGTAVDNASPYTIGNRDSDDARYWDGTISEFAIYDGAGTLANAQAMAGGADAYGVFGGALACYVPLFNSARDWINADATATDVTYTTHPTVAASLMSIALEFPDIELAVYGGDVFVSLETLTLSTAWNIFSSEIVDTSWHIFNGSTVNTSWNIFGDISVSTAWHIFAKTQSETAWNIFINELRNTSWHIFGEKGQNITWNLNGVIPIGVPSKISVASKRITISKATKH